MEEWDAVQAARSRGPAVVPDAGVKCRGGEGECAFNAGCVYGCGSDQFKPLNDPKLQELFSATIDGALTSGYQGVAPAPDGHWLESWWKRGRSVAEHEQAIAEKGKAEREALTAIMRTAEAAKEACSMDPESPAAIRNGKFATIAGMAAQGLGMVRGPSLAAPAAEPAGVLDAVTYAASRQMAVTKEWCRGWDECRQQAGAPVALHFSDFLDPKNCEVTPIYGPAGVPELPLAPIGYDEAHSATIRTYGQQCHAAGREQERALWGDGAWYCRNCNAFTLHDMRGVDLCCSVCHSIAASRKTASAPAQPSAMPDAGVSLREQFQRWWYEFYHSGYINVRSNGRYFDQTANCAWDAVQHFHALGRQQGMEQAKALKYRVESTMNLEQAPAEDFNPGCYVVPVASVLMAMEPPLSPQPGQEKA